MFVPILLALVLLASAIARSDDVVGFGEVQDFGKRRAGDFREPFSLASATCAHYFAFMGRSPFSNTYVAWLNVF